MGEKREFGERKGVRWEGRESLGIGKRLNDGRKESLKIGKWLNGEERIWDRKGIK